MSSHLRSDDFLCKFFSVHLRSGAVFHVRSGDCPTYNGVNHIWWPGLKCLSGCHTRIIGIVCFSTNIPSIYPPNIQPSIDQPILFVTLAGFCHNYGPHWLTQWFCSDLPSMYSFWCEIKSLQQEQAKPQHSFIIPNRLALSLRTSLGLIGQDLSWQLGFGWGTGPTFRFGVSTNIWVARPAFRLRTRP